SASRKTRLRFGSCGSGRAGSGKVDRADVKGCRLGEGQQERVAPRIAEAVTEQIGADLAPAAAELERRYPCDPRPRQPVHTVYVPGDDFTADTPRVWGDRALALLDEHAPDAASCAAALGLDEALAADVHERVRAKLARDPVEDLRVDFEDGYGGRTDAEEDRHAARAARLIAGAHARGGGGPRTGTEAAAPYAGIRMKCME